MSYSYIPDIPSQMDRPIDVIINTDGMNNSHVEIKHREFEQYEYEIKMASSKEWGSCNICPDSVRELFTGVKSAGTDIIK